MLIRYYLVLLIVICCIKASSSNGANVGNAPNKNKEQYKQAIRMDNWKGIKYITENRFELYNI